MVRFGSDETVRVEKLSVMLHVTEKNIKYILRVRRCEPRVCRRRT